MDENGLPPSAWTSLEKIGFRFAFLFFGLFIVIENNGGYPFWEWIMYYPTELLHKVIPWIGKHILHLSYDITVFTNGSGDTTYDYVIVFSILVLSVAGTIFWSVFDNKKTNYEKLYYWLTVAIRFYVGLMLINYGLYKVFKLQFPGPGPAIFSQTFGEASPMRLAWTFLGFSYGYNLFMGLAELAAVLLLFRRTMTLGAIITLMTTSNVMAVNYFYDVPVKILSTALVLMTIFLLTNDARRLWAFFISGKPVALPVIKAPLMNNKIQLILKYIFKYGAIAYGLLFGGFQAYKSLSLYGDNAPKPELYGLYDAHTFVMKNDTLPPLTSDSRRWKQFVVEWPNYSMVKYMNDSTQWFATKVDTSQMKLVLLNSIDSSRIYSFTYSKPGEDQILLNGTYVSDTISVLLKNQLTNKKKIQLINRGFHWINEYPFNR